MTDANTTAATRGVRDRSDAIEVVYRYRGGARKLTFEPRSDGRYDLLEQTLTKGGHWREVGHEIVDDVHVAGATDGAAVLSRPE